MNKKPFYITTTLPYVNADPHIGHALEFIRADIIARSKRLAGYEVFFNTGTDEHGLKIYQTAQKLGMSTQAYVDDKATRFKNMLPLLGMATDVPGITSVFTRTTDQHHLAAAQEFWKIVQNNGFIYKKDYSIKYCVGCELEKTESELVDGHCHLHPLMEIEVIAEENYFFKFSAFQERLLALYAERPDFVVPDFRFNEIKSFVSGGLEDFSVSRLATKMPWGIKVPGDESQVMYVWFDALVNYISAIGWPDGGADNGANGGEQNLTSFQKWWIQSGGVVQYCGKDNIRQQSAMWQAMLMAAGLPPSRIIVINGFITGDGGIKMSKSLGNTVDPLEIVNEYGTDALRYYCARELHPFEDSPFTMERFKESYNAALANGLGNLVSRVLKMAEANGIWIDLPEQPVDWAKLDLELDSFDIKKFCDTIWERIERSDKYIDQTKPFKALKDEDAGKREEGKKAVQHLLGELWTISHMLSAVMPDTAEAIKKLIQQKR